MDSSVEWLKEYLMTHHEEQHVKYDRSTPGKNECYVLKCSIHVDCGAEWGIFTRADGDFEPRVRLPNSTWDGKHGTVPLSSLVSTR